MHNVVIDIYVHMLDCSAFYFIHSISHNIHLLRTHLHVSDEQTYKIPHIEYLKNSWYSISLINSG